VVDLVLFLALPELVDPPQGIGGGEDLRRQRRQQAFQLDPVLRGEGNLQERVVRPENLREHPLGAAADVIPDIRLSAFLLSPFAFLLGQFLGLIERDRHARFRLDQQAVLGQKAGEEHAMPVLVSALTGEMSNLVVHAAAVRFGKPSIPELTSTRAEVVAQFPLVRCHMRIWLMMMDCQGF